MVPRLAGQQETGAFFFCPDQIRHLSVTQKNAAIEPCVARRDLIRMLVRLQR